jgi:hypothetical protein
MKDEIYNIFISTEGFPDSPLHLEEYIDFLLNYTYDNESYSEVHHILPRSKYPEYITESWNMIRLKYEDHIKAHEILFKAYNNRAYQRTLNFMNSKVYKDSDLVSAAAKKGWETLKNDKEKYDSFCKKRSESMKKLSSEEQGRRSKKGWDNLSEEQYEKRCEINKENWTDELKLIKSEQMKEYFKNNPNVASERGIKRYENMSEEERISFKNKMNDVNKDPAKREKAGSTIKKHWQDPEFIEKMRNRKKKPGDKYEIIDRDGNILYREGLHAIVNEFNFNITLIRQFANTGLPAQQLTSRKKSQAAINTEGYKFNKL